MKNSLSLCLLIGVLAACRDDLPANGVQQCAVGTTKDVCPGGFECVSGFCWQKGTGPGQDSGEADAAPGSGGAGGSGGGGGCDLKTENAVNGGCLKKCTPMVTRCSPTSGSVQLCNDLGEWSEVSNCAAGCKDNACNECTPDKARCTEGRSQRCGADGKWAVATPCASGCVEGVCNECSGGSICTNDGKLQPCNEGKRGAPMACGDGKYCTVGACLSCAAAPSACTGAGIFCAADPVSVVTCAVNVTTGCLALVSSSTCPSDKGTCTNGTCVACVANTTRPCSASGKKGTCAGGTETCNAGAWGTCSIQPVVMDSCVAGNDDNCDGTPSAGCICDGFAMPNPASSGLKNAASYDVSVTGIVTDKVTRLVWEAAVSPSRYTQSDASVYCGDKGAGWRLPTIVELYSLVDFTADYPSIDVSAFPATPQEDFWTSTTVAGTGMSSRFVNFELGDTYMTTPSYFAFVRCVRGFSTAANLPAPKCYPPGSRYTVSAAEVADGRTGLRWQRGVAPVAKTWVDAVAYCSTVGDGFRLPSVKELLTIVDFNKVTVKADPVFEGTTAAGFWTSSPRVKNSSYAWLINFENGVASNQAKTSVYQVRCVK